MLNLSQHFLEVTQFDRAAHLRTQYGQIHQALVGEKSAILPFFNGSFLTTSIEMRRRVSLLSGKTADRLVHDPSQFVFLGMNGKTPLFSLDVTRQDALAQDLSGTSCDWVCMRDLALELASPMASLLAYARAMHLWHQNHLFCSRCGTANKAIESGHVRQCNNAKCGKLCFPRTDPAVIMLIATPDDQMCLLARHTRSKVGHFSTLAGFVEPGETLEDAVRREAWEEAGIMVGEVRYQLSQPWPFPASLMMGFKGIALTRHLKLDPKELAQANWFSRDELARAGEWGEANALCLSPKDSISRALINNWLHSRV